MRRFTRIAIIAIIIAASILVGVAIDLLWGAFQRYIYPDDYLSSVQQYAYEYNVPEPLILAVIKAESNFDPRAKSRAGALGLMQMMPSTFLELTSDEHLGENLSEEDLFIPEVSIRYGTYYLSLMHKMFDNNWDNALCAYNAGPGNVTKWLADTEYSDGNGNLTYIPFKETRNYLEKVNKYTETYRNLYYTSIEEIKKYEE